MKFKSVIRDALAAVKKRKTDFGDGWERPALWERNYELLIIKGVNYLEIDICGKFTVAKMIDNIVLKSCSRDCDGFNY
jgi:hypothetical protein